MATKHFAPSKDALRLLRSLALLESPYTRGTETIQSCSQTHGRRCLTTGLSRRGSNVNTSGSKLVNKRWISSKGQETTKLGLNTPYMRRAQSSVAVASAPHPEVDDVTPRFALQLSSKQSDTVSTVYYAPIVPGPTHIQESTSNQANAQYIPLFPQGKTSSPHASRSRKESRTVDANAKKPELELLHVRNRVITLWKSGGSDAAAALLRTILRTYVSTEEHKDWELAKTLYFGLYHLLPAEKLRMVRYDVVEEMLQSSPPRLEAIDLLKSGSASALQWPHRYLVEYMSTFCENYPNNILQLAEIEKVLKGMVSSGIPMTAGVFLPFVRNAANAGHVDVAHAHLTRLSEKYSLEPSFSVLTELIRGYGRQANWSEIDKIFTWLHDQKLARSQPNAFASLFRRAFTLYANYDHSKEHIYDFVTYCVHNCGLVLTAKLSGEILNFFTSKRRLDLVQNFIKDRRTAFVDLLSPARTEIIACELATTWSVRQDSCMMILETCKALAYGAVRDPFSEALRYVVAEALSENLMIRCRRVIKIAEHEARTIKTGVPNSVDVDAGFQGVHDYACQVLKALRLQIDQPRNTKLFIQLDDLSEQLEAARATMLMVGDFTTYCHEHGSLVCTEDGNMDDLEEQKAASLSHQKLVRHLRTDSLTDVPDLVKTVEESLRHLDEVKSAGSKYEKFVVQFIVALRAVTREQDAVKVLQHLHKSRWTHILADRTIYLVWLQLAVTTMDHRALVEVLWAIVDSSSEIKLPARALILVRVAQREILRECDKGTKHLTVQEVEELEYLKQRIYRRKWRQMGYPDAEQIDEINLRDWRRSL